MELSDAMDRVEELQSMNYEMLDYLRTQIVGYWSIVRRIESLFLTLIRRCYSSKGLVKFYPTNAYRPTKNTHPTKRGTEPSYIIDSRQ
jgi:hypothetical protein